MLGADNLVKFMQWKNAQYLLDNYHFVVMNRDELSCEELLNNLNKKDYSILHCANFDVSSTYIRDNLNNYELIKDMVDKEVVDILLNA